MSRKSTQRIAAAISLCLIFAVIGVFSGLRQLNAQGAPGGTGGMSVPPGISMTPPGGAGGGMGGMMIPGMPGMGGGMGGSQPTSGVTESAPKGPVITLSKIARGIQTKSVRNWDGRLTPMLRFKYQLAPKRVLTVYLPKVLAAEKHTKEGWEAVFQSFSMDKEAIVDTEIKNNPTPQSSSTSGGATGGGMMGMPGMGGGMPGMPGMIGGGSGIPMLPPMR